MKITVEASWPNYPNKNAQLVSPCYDLSVSSSLTFAYHMQGSNNAVGSLEVFVSTDGGATWTSVFFRSGDQGSDWNQALVDLSAYTGQTVEFRLSATTAMSWRGDIAVDNVCVVESILGCTDPMATNFDPSATVDDGSCTLFTCAGTVDLPYCTDFETGLGLWSQSDDDAFDWTLQSGGTASWGTGPSGASSGNFYIYAEASYPNYPFKQAFINTPCFNLENAVNPSIAFDYHMFGTFVGAIYLQASVDGVSWDFLWYESGNQGDQWLTAEVSLVDYIGFEQVQLRFIGQTAHGWQSDLALDNVCVEEQPSLLPKPEPITGIALDRAIANFTKEYTGETPLQEPEFGTDMEVAMYPNPVLSSGSIYLNITDIPASADRVVMTMRDLTGKIVYSTEYAVDGSDLRRIIDLQSRLTAGTYFVSIIAGDVVTTERIMVTR